MKKLILVLFFLQFFFSCHQEVEVYNESNVIVVDTLNIERIKIETH